MASSRRRRRRKNKPAAPKKTDQTNTADQTSAADVSVDAAASTALALCDPPAPENTNCETAEYASGTPESAQSPSPSNDAVTPSEANAASPSEDNAAIPRDERRISDALENVERLLTEVSSPKTLVPPDLADSHKNLARTVEIANQQLAADFKKLAKSFESQVEELRGTISLQLGQLNSNQRTITGTASAIAETADSSEANNWENQKLEMFAKYGEACPSDHAVEEDAVESNEADDLASLQESLHDSIESLDDVQAEEIGELRAQLTEKLREAEVELSINRAKLDRRKANLDRRQTELDRREKSLDSKYSQIDGKPEKKGILDRLTRHLGVRTQADSL